MEIVSQNKIDDLIDNGYHLRVSEYISGGIQMVKENLGVFVGFTLITFIINSIAGMIPFASLAVSAPLTAGFFLAANRLSEGYEVDFSDFFKGFDYFGQLVVYSILFGLLIVVLSIPAFMLAGTMIVFDLDGDVSVLFAILFGLGMVATVLYLAISFMWAPHLILFANKRAWESMELSHKLIKKDIWNFVGFAMLLGLFNLAGALCFGIGLVFTVPVSACALYLAFEDVTEMRLENSDQYIDRHLVD